MRNKYIKPFLLVLGSLSLVFTSCEPYEDFTKDFDKTTVYFGTQKPLRTIVSDNQMDFKVGVTFGGRRENNSDEFADFVIDPSLLNDIPGASVFTLLPENYYTLSNSSRMLIPKGKFIGDVTVTLNRDMFTNDPTTTNRTYALPLRITNTSLDSIAAGSFDQDGNTILARKDYTILVVKYISSYSGTFYHKGTQRELNASGGVVNEVVYNNSDLVKNQTWDLTTVDRNSVKTSGIGAVLTHNFVININELDNTLSIDSPSAGVTNLIGSGTYAPLTGIISIEYSYTLGGKNYQVSDTLVIRTSPEQNLRFEEW
ncbi:protein of unknown function [Flavobacterium flevense]|uniref:BT-3987-like N-terminal domain-containing protein n=1 Tax=Flavobacterium flevense TaxID=983 RepID=A0A4Y4B1K5_9FLAO|nr:DUF1735 domain-containing protein [Flavobacterium flevense]GEC72774.1 hypothetical protein FFL01_23130 [Flavobacterium flevense]SHM16651.1 protein of unknown function [Flavobacterium flevense]